MLIAPGWPGMPRFWDLVQLSTEIPLRLPVSTTFLKQSTTSEPPRLVSRSGQLQEQGFSVEVAERIAASQRSSTSTIYRSKWALFEKWCRENSVNFSTPSVKQVSTVSPVPDHSLCETSLRLFHVPVPRSKQASFNH